VDTNAQIGVVRPAYGALRRALLPIYARDQLITVALLALPFLWLTTVNPRLAAFTGVGAYIGVILTMQRSTPSRLLLASDQERQIVVFLDNARFLKRTGEGDEWMSTRSRLKRWDTDAIRVRRTPTGVLVTGRRVDLQIIAQQLRA
jgi:hypothetical protein